MLDFGLAKLSTTPNANRRMSRSSQPTERFSSMVGTTVGTVSYMSPEQARGEDVDPRTDLFSFGVVLYEMATGQQSFSGATTAVVFDGILNRDPAPPSTINANDPDRARSHHLEGAREGPHAALSIGRRHARRSPAAQARLRIAADDGGERRSSCAAATASGSQVTVAQTASGVIPPVPAERLAAHQHLPLSQNGNRFRRCSSPAL